MTQLNKLAILIHRIGPYHLARLNELGKYVPTVAIELSGADRMYAWDAVRTSGPFERLTLFNSDSSELSNATVISRITSALDEWRPGVIAIPGWSFTEALAALRWSTRTNTPAILLSDSTAWDETRAHWKEWIKSRLVGCYSSGFVAGAPHAEYLSQLGMPAGRIVQGYDVVDNAHFTSGADLARNCAEEMRARHQLPDNYFLASARFVKKKNLEALIKAYARYRDQLSSKTDQSMRPWNLVLIGDGPLRPQISELISRLAPAGSVQMPGFKQYPDLPIYYGLAGAFIHASTTEQWGLVVNEAMASGLAVLISSRCGCVQDLVQEGVNGFTFDPNNLDQLASLMFQVAHSENSTGSPKNTQITPMGIASRKIISNWGTDRFAKGLAKACELALEIPARKTSIMDRVLMNLLLRRRPPCEN